MVFDHRGEERIPAPWRGRPVVVVVEEDESVRSFVSQAIGKSYVVLEAEEAAGALALCRRYGQPVDLLVTSLAQPGIAGPDGLRERLGPETRVLFLLMYTTDAEIPEEKWTFFLKRPFRRDALRLKVREILPRP